MSTELSPSPTIKEVYPFITSATVVLFNNLLLENCTYMYRCRLTGSNSEENTCSVRSTRCGDPSKIQMNITGLHPDTNYSLTVTHFHGDCESNDVNFTTGPPAGTTNQAKVYNMFQKI